MFIFKLILIREICGHFVDNSYSVLHNKLKSEEEICYVFGIRIFVPILFMPIDIKIVPVWRQYKIHLFKYQCKCRLSNVLKSIKTND